jgi:histone acetyltransferase MYST1
MWRDKKYHPVRIIERRRKAVRRGAAAASAAGEGGADPSQLYEYYVHYLEFNRRLDEWVTLERMDLDTAVDSSGEGRGRRAHTQPEAEGRRTRR